MEESNKKQSALDERIRKFRDDTDMSLRMLDAATKNLQGKSEQLTQEILTSGMADEVKTKMRNEMKVKKEPVPFDLPNVNPYDELTIPPIQFPGHLKELEDEAQAFRTLEGLKRLKINRYLIRVVKRMPEYLMYVKDVFSSKKTIVEKDAVRLNDRCTTVLQSQPPPKENDLGSFTLPCLIGNSRIRSALADLGASINVMPFFMFKKLQIKNLQPANMMVEMADMTKKAHKGIIENVLVQIDKFIFPLDVVIIDMVEDHNVPLILGRPLLATVHAHIDIFNKHISLGVGEESFFQNK
ncbi:transposon ty3-I gag-pol polyprotein [Tanacetum coccineum]